MKVFLSHALAPWDATIAARLRAVAAAYDIIILLPDRSRPFTNGLITETSQNISESEAVIALVTKNASESGLQFVNYELQVASQQQKPIIGLIEIGTVEFRAGPGTQVVPFDRSEPVGHEAKLMNALDQIRQQKSKSNLTALGWIVGIALGLVALGSLVGEKTE